MQKYALICMTNISYWFRSTYRLEAKGQIESKLFAKLGKNLHSSQSYENSILKF